MEDDYDSMDEPGDEIPYALPESIDFSIITNGFRQFPFFEDDVWLGMQGINVGIVDALVTQMEYALLREQFRIERTPGDQAMMVSALTQMWIYSLYEVLRLWRDRHFQFRKLLASGGIGSRLKSMEQRTKHNWALQKRSEQLKLFRDSEEYRVRIESTWARIEGVFRFAELFRMNLAKHAAPGKDSAIPRAPGYGRINRWCGALDYELMTADGYYTFNNRRDIADSLRAVFSAA